MRRDKLSDHKYMNLEEYKNTYFDGDEDKALHQLAYESYNRNYNYYKNEKTATNIRREFTPKQEDRYIDFLVEETNKNPIPFLNGMQKASVIMQSGLSYEEIKDAKKNPYKSKIWKTLLKALIGIVAVAIFMWIAVSANNDELAETAPYILSVFGSYIAIELTSNISNFFCFKKAKKQIDCDELAEDDCEKIIQKKDI